MSDEWKTIESAPENVPVRTKIHDAKGERNDQTLMRRGRLWWADTMYVYYTPTHWMPISPAEGGTSNPSPCSQEER